MAVNWRVDYGLVQEKLRGSTCCENEILQD